MGAAEGSMTGAAANVNDENAMGMFKGRVEIIRPENYNTVNPRKTWKINNYVKNVLADAVINNNLANLKPVLSKIYGIDAVENLDMSYSDHYLDTPFAHEHTIIKSADDIEISYLRDAVKDKIKSQLVPYYGKSIINNISGILFDENSASSKRLAQNEYIRKFIQNNKEDIKNNGIIAASSIRFYDTNFHNAIGSADVIDMYLNDNGEIILKLTDTYDFNENSPGAAVQAGRKYQESGKLKPYFMIYCIKIDKETAARYLI